MTTLLTPGGYSERDVLRWLDQAKELLEQTLARIATAGGGLNPADRQAVTDNLVLIANVVTHLSRQALRPAAGATDPVNADDAPDFAEHPGVLSRLHDIHDRVQAVYHRLQASPAALN
jgi:hypothetical protein